MRKGLLMRLSLAVLSLSTAASAASIQLGGLALNYVGVVEDAGQNSEFLEFRLANWTGTPFGQVATPVTFSNVNLDLTWSGAAPPGIVGGLDWYLDGDEGHLNSIGHNLAPNILSYESSRFSKSYTFSKGVLTMDLSPSGPWQTSTGQWVMPASTHYELVFWIDPTESGLNSLSRGLNFSGPGWDVSAELVSAPEPASVVLGGLGVLGLLIRRRYQRAA